MFGRKFIPASSKLGRSLTHAKGSRMFSGLVAATPEALERAEWNEAVEQKKAAKKARKERK